jgi:hypothetical protein
MRIRNTGYYPLTVCWSSRFVQVNARDSAGRVPLHIAAAHGHDLLVGGLLAVNGDPHARKRPLFHKKSRCFSPVKLSDRLASDNKFCFSFPWWQNIIFVFFRQICVTFTSYILLECSVKKLFCRRKKKFSVVPVPELDSEMCTVMQCCGTGTAGTVSFLPKKNRNRILALGSGSGSGSCCKQNIKLYLLWRDTGRHMHEAGERRNQNQGNRQEFL